MNRVADNPFDSALDAVLLASRAVVAIAARSLPEWADVTLVQFRALVLLERDGQLNAGRLAELMGVSAPTATAMCDRLDAKRLITRGHSETSRREIVVKLTPTGKALVDSAIANRRLAMARVLERIPAEKLQGMTDALVGVRRSRRREPRTGLVSGLADLTPARRRGRSRPRGCSPVIPGQGQPGPGRSRMVGSTTSMWT